MTHELVKANGRIIDKKFDEWVTVIISLPVSEAASFQQRYHGK
jgi:hypothetical protein